MISEQMKELLDNGDHTRVINGAWPAIKEVLVEQQLILATEDDDAASNKLKGFAVAYRCLEQFHKRGKADAASAKKSSV